MNTHPPPSIAGRPRRSGAGPRLGPAFGPIAQPMAGTRWFPLWAILRHTGPDVRDGLLDADRGPARRPMASSSRSPLATRPSGRRTCSPPAAARSGSPAASTEIGEPRLVDGEDAAAHLPAVIRFVSGRLGLRHFVLVRRISGWLRRPRLAPSVGAGRRRLRRVLRGPRPTRGSR